MKRIDVLTICNALVDLLVKVEDETLSDLGIEKSLMHLVDAESQAAILKTLGNHDLTVELGGSGMNAARAMAAAGAEVSFFGKIGRDHFGEQIKEQLKSKKIGDLVTGSDVPTGTCLVLITPDGERTLNTSLGASCHYASEDLPLDQIASSKILHFTGYQWSTPNQKGAIEKAMAKAKESGTKISFDVADPFVVEQFRDEFRGVISEYADVVFANEAEAKGIYGTDPKSAADKISETGAVAAIKLGAKGAIIASEGRVETIDPIPTEVVDTTAAGDMFAGGFLVGYVNDRPLKECGEMAAILAGDVISRVGAKLSDEAVSKVAIK